MLNHVYALDIKAHIFSNVCAKKTPTIDKISFAGRLEDSIREKTMRVPNVDESYPELLISLTIPISSMGQVYLPMHMNG